jgi:hypothetical protein
MSCFLACFLAGGVFVFSIAGGVCCFVAFAIRSRARCPVDALGF